MLVMTERSSLRVFREELGLSQEGLARLTPSVSMGTVRNAEGNKRVTYDTAIQLLEAINAARVARSLAAVKLEDLHLKLR